MSTLIEVKNLHLSHTRGEIITVTHVEKPYGEHSSPIVSIGTSYHGKKNNSVVEIPYENVDEVIKALQESKKVCDTFVHETFHGELDADMGGGE
ncbi:MAG: hypothetical protein HRT43_06895 [Campylobacteraceae bacterium]|nr:hypothetical protein [Campylobacteraceae bacterium]